MYCRRQEMHQSLQPSQLPLEVAQTGLRVAYVTPYDPEDPLQWSGLGAHIYKCLRLLDFDVDGLGPLPAYSHARRHWLRLKSAWYNRFLRRRFGHFSAERDHHIATVLAKAVAAKLQTAPYDLVVSPGSIPVAFLETDVPIVIWADATFHSLATTYPECRNKTRSYYEDGEALERMALWRASLCVYSSEWAAQSAIEHYGVEARKVKVIPFGANVDDDVSDDDIQAAIAQRCNGPMRLLFIGVDFMRKGGPKVLEVTRELLRLEVPVELHIIGCTPDVPELLRPHTTVHGFISKASREGREKIAAAFLRSSWLILLPSAECYGLVFAEANRYGVPCIASRVGGIPTIVRDDCNGKLFTSDAAAGEIARYIAQASSQTDRYRGMAIASHKEYEARLNWRVAGKAFADSVAVLSGAPTD